MSLFHTLGYRYPMKGADGDPKNSRKVPSKTTLKFEGIQTEECRRRPVCHNQDPFCIVSSSRINSGRLGQIEHRCHVIWGAFQGNIGSSIARVSWVVEGTGTAEGVDATEGACATDGAGAAGGARARGAGTTLMLGGGGKRLPGSKGNPYRKQKNKKNSPDLAHYFWESPKFTCNNKQK